MGLSEEIMNDLREVRGEWQEHDAFFPKSDNEEAEYFIGMVNRHMGGPDSHKSLKRRQGPGS